MCYRVKQIGIEEPNVESVDKYRIPADQVSPEIAAKFQPLMRSLAALR